MKKDKTSGTGKGLISSGGDKAGYLGHFRNADVLKRGHNQGAPGGDLVPPANAPAPSAPPVAGAGGLDLSHPAVNPISNPAGFAKAHGVGGGAKRTARPTYDPKLNPVLGTRQELRASGKLGTGEGRAEMKAARIASSKIPAGERNASARAARAAVAPGAPNANDALAGAKSSLKTAIGGVRTARQGLRSAIRGGDVAGAASAFGNLQSARGARRTARAGVRTARGMKV